MPGMSGDPTWWGQPPAFRHGDGHDVELALMGRALFRVGKCSSGLAKFPIKLITAKPSLSKGRGLFPGSAHRGATVRTSIKTRQSFKQSRWAELPARAAGTQRRALWALAGSCLPPALESIRGGRAAELAFQKSQVSSSCLSGDGTEHPTAPHLGHNTASGTGRGENCD